MTTSLSPTAIYSSLLGGRRAGWGTKCDLYIYSRTEKNLYPATVSQHFQAFLGCTEVIYPFVKSTGGECTNRRAVFLKKNQTFWALQRLVVQALKLSSLF